MSSSTAAPARATASSVRFPPALKVFAWLSFLAETIIIGTGGAVRLTGSGLGCSEWPLCTPDSLVPTQELGIHGVIEFGNRTMTGVVGIVAIGVLLLTLGAIASRREVFAALWFAAGGIVAAVIAYLPTREFWVSSAVLLVVVIIAAIHSIRSVHQRRDLLTLAWIVVAGVVAQAFAGGLTVLSGLNAFLVGFHYTASLALVCVTAAYLVRLRQAPGRRELAVSRGYAVLTHVMSLFLAITIVFGVLTTSNGPHSGDAAVIRDGFDATFLSHVHSWPGYILFVLALVNVVIAWTKRLPTRTWSLVFLAALLVQIGVGVWQANAALPPLLVGIHMVLAALTSAAYVALILNMKRPVAA